MDNTLYTYFRKMISNIPNKISLSEANEIEEKLKELYKQMTGRTLF